MKFSETSLAGAYVVAADSIADGRGLFARTFCTREFSEHQLCGNFVQANTSFNFQRGTLRGMHFQVDPLGEVKLVRCTRGRIFDVIVDVRKHSPQRGQWFGLELSQENRAALYVPKGFAHGFQTLDNDCEVLYLMSEFYNPSLARGLRHDDPEVGIRWPLPITQMSERDRDLPELREI